jgi:hypothetical protein
MNFAPAHTTTVTARSPGRSVAAPLRAWDCPQEEYKPRTSVRGLYGSARAIDKSPGRKSGGGVMMGRSGATTSPVDVDIR